MKPTCDLFAVLGTLVQEFVAGALMLFEQLDEVTNCRRDSITLRSGSVVSVAYSCDKQHVREKFFKIGKSVAQINGVVD